MTKAVSPSFFLFIFTSVLLELTNYGFSYCKFSSVAVNSAKSNFPISASTFCFADTAIIFICFIMFHLFLGCTSWQKISIIHEIKKNGEFCLCISQWDCCEHYSSKSLKLPCLPSPTVAQLHLLCMYVKMKLSQSCLTLCDSSVNLYWVSSLSLKFLFCQNTDGENKRTDTGGKVGGRSGLEDWDWYVYPLCVK